MNKDFILKGDILYSTEEMIIESYPDSYLICNDGKCEGVFTSIPEAYKEFPIEDYSGKIIIPGLTDLHAHAPQYTFRGLGMDMELIDWLNENAFPEEAHFEDLEYAKNAYSIFVDDLKNSATTRAVIFGTLHKEATSLLMDMLDETGLVTYVGKVNMDRNGSEGLCEPDSATAIRNTKEWIENTKNKYKNTKPILTPRFIPSCSDELMHAIGEISSSENIRIQSHLSENPFEIRWVKELVPHSENYGDAYAGFNALGNTDTPAVMAHCVYISNEEIELLKEHGTYVAHCPDSNMNLSSGIAPIRKLLNSKINVGLGSDVAAGASLSIVQAMSHAIQVSKMYWRYVNSSYAPLKFNEAFYIGTLGGGKYFGKVGSFLNGYEFDALVIDDSKIRSTRATTLQERCERMIYLPAEYTLISKYVKGQKVV